MGDVVDLDGHRPPVQYDVTIIQDYDGGLVVRVHDVGTDTRSREAAASALRRAADLVETGECREIET